MNGELNVSRSIGSRKHKPYVSADADYFELEIDYSHECLVMCSDGLMEKLHPEEIAQYVHHTKQMGLSDNEVCHGLISMATDSKSRDNISVSVTSLSHFV